MVWRCFESGSFSSAFELSKVEEKWAGWTHEASIVRVHFGIYIHIRTGSMVSWRKRSL